MASGATASLKLEAHALMRKYKALVQALKAAELSATADQDILPAKVFADEMASLYLSRFESVYRILHVPTFRAEYERYWADPKQADNGLTATIQLVVAIGSSTCSTAGEEGDFRTVARQWVHSAQNWISAPLQKSKVTVSGVQLQCLLILARQVLNVGGDLVWISMGNVVRTAMQVGLHRDPSHFETMTIL